MDTAPKRSLVRDFNDLHKVTESRRIVQIYTATEDNGNTVAIKVFPRRIIPPKMTHRKVSGAINHAGNANMANPLSYFDDLEAETLCFVLPYAAGGSISSICGLKTQRKLEEKVVLAIMKGVLEALKKFHSCHHAHRAVKPGNILLSRENGSWVVKLADYILSLEVDTYGTDDDAAYWIAPENRILDGYDCRSDIWSFGATALELLYGHPPLVRHHTSSELMRARIMERFLGWQYDEEEVSAVPVSPEFVSMIKSCLERDATERATAKDLLELDVFTSIENATQIIDEIMTNVPPVHERGVDEPRSAGTGYLSAYEVPVLGWMFNERRVCLEEI